MAERLIVVGGDAAGMSAASQARRLRGPEDLQIIAFEQGRHVSYSACGIPYLVGGEVTDPDRLIARTAATFRDRLAIDVRLRHRVEALDLENRAVQVRDLETGDRRREIYDQLMLATGAVPLRPKLPGVDAPGVHGVQTLDDGLAVLAALDDSSVRRAVVVGGGYIGLEMAEAFLRRGLEVSVIDAAPAVMPSLDPDMGGLVAEGMRDLGIAVHCGERLTGIELRSGHAAAVVTDRGSYPADVVLLGLGAGPNVALAREAGVPLGPSGAVAVDRRMRTGVPGLWAAGDCVEKFHRVSRAPVAIALGTYANKEGRVAGINLGGRYATFPGVLGTAVSKICSLEVGRTGLKEAEAVAAGFETLSVVVESTTRASYYPGAQMIKTKLVVERRSGRLLGAQVVGREGAAKRIDVLAAALWAEMSVDEILNLDVSYAPPFSPLWDPVLIAARKAWQRVEEDLAASPLTTTALS
jgi:NADPH-dependent 2,4-dienoyl-CoA reductase/sulfur reductase-like enzyme